MRKVALAVLLLWELPVLLLCWLFYVLPLWVVSKDFKLVKAGFPCTFVLASTMSWYAKLWSNWGGNALPECIIVNAPGERGLNPGTFEQADEIVWNHEARHILQWRGLGPLFPFVYGLLSLACLVMGEHPSTSNPLEEDAVAHQEEFEEPPWYLGSVQLPGKLDS